MYVCLEKDYLEKNRKKMEQDALSVIGDPEGKNNLLIEETIREEYDNIEFNDGVLSLTIDTEIGLFGASVRLDDEVIFEMIEYMKAKGEKLKKLIKLAD